MRLTIRKPILTQAISVTIALLAAGSASASINFSSTIDLQAGSGKAFAKEIDAKPGADVKKLGSSGAATTTSGVLSTHIKTGGEISQAAPRYVRFELDNGDTNAATRPVFNKVPKGCFGTGSSIGSMICNVSHSLGGVGTHYVVYEIAQSIGKDEFVGFHFEDPAEVVKISSTAQDIKVNYSLHTNEVSAGQNLTSGGSVVKSLTGLSFIKFTPALDFTVLPNNALTAEVEKNFVKFTPDASSGALATLTYKVADNVAKLDGSNIALTDLLSASTLEVAGDMTGLINVDSSGAPQADTFPAAPTTTDHRIYLADDCTTAAPTAAHKFTTLDKAKATFSLGTGAFTAKKLCLRPAVADNSQSTVEIPEATYTAKLSPTAQANYTLSPLDVALGAVLHNGTTLEVPYFTTNPNYFRSRFLLSHLNPNGKDAKFKVKIQSDSGAKPVITDANITEGVLKKGTVLQIDASQLVTKFQNADGTDGRPRGSAIFTIVSPNDDVQGVYQMITMDGEISSVLMLRPGGADGK